MNHHYVPQCYLKQFLNREKKLTVLNLDLLKERGKFKTSFFTESSICYDVDGYKIPANESSDSPYRELNNYEPHHIEKVAFSDFENNFPKEYLALINTSAKSINKSFWSNGIVSLKKRNPYYLAIQRFDTITSGAFANLRTELKKITDSPDAFEALRIVTAKITDDPDAKQKFYLSSLIHDSESKNNLKDIEQIIASLTWELLITDEKYPFVTTDNPGFAITSDGNLNNLKFLDDEAEVYFYMPLSPSHCLKIISSPLVKPVFNTYINRYKISPYETLAINLNSILLASKYCISNDEQFLKGMESEIKSRFYRSIQDYGFPYCNTLNKDYINAEYVHRAGSNLYKQNLKS